jgi:capsular polysaccharide biosynthesis protein
MTRLPPALRPLWPYAKRGYTVGTRLAAPVTTWLSARRGGVLPTRVATTLEDALRRPGQGTVHTIAPAATTVRDLPTGTPPHLPTFARQTRARFAPQRVLELPQGRVLGPHRAVITGDGTLLHELVRYFGAPRPREHPLFLHPFAAPPTRIDGTLAVLASRGDGNYYHFLHDVVPRLALLDRCPGVGQPDLWYVPRRTRFQQGLIELLDLPAERIVDADEIPHVRAERLLVPTLPDLDLNHPAWATQYLRDRLLPADAGLRPGRRIYVTRGTAPHSRIVVNEDEVLESLAPLGFERIDPAALSVAEQIRAFAEAEFILAPHGAALANLAFAGAGATVLELFAPDFVQGCYWKLATTVPGLRYRYFVGEGRAGRLREGLGVSSDIRIDVRSLNSLIEHLLVEPVGAPSPRCRAR